MIFTQFHTLPLIKNNAEDEEQREKERVKSFLLADNSDEEIGNIYFDDEEINSKERILQQKLKSLKKKTIDKESTKIDKESTKESGSIPRDNVQENDDDFVLVDTVEENMKSKLNITVSDSIHVKGDELVDNNDNGEDDEEYNTEDADFEVVYSCESCK